MLLRRYERFKVKLLFWNGVEGMERGNLSYINVREIKEI